MIADYNFHGNDLSRLVVRSDELRFLPWSATELDPSPRGSIGWLDRLMGSVQTSPDALVRESFGRREFLRRGSGALLLALGGALPACAGRRDETGGPGPFSETERDVLRAICARLLPAGGRAPGAAAIDVAGRMERLLDELQATSDFRRLLALFEWSPLLFEANPHRFTQLSPESQNRVLRGWAASRLGFRRSGFVAIKRLAMSLYYTQAENWPAIGFPGPWLQS